ncbi:MAG: DUF4861 domain-containing protein [Tannerella sp.]|jgi:hypothetical protein|nr:DUF4861 domain-containing protein [Tannerella sp.]
MKKFVFFISVFIGLMSCESRTNVSIKNPSYFDRTEIVEIPIEKLAKLQTDRTYVVKNQQNEVLPSQVTYDGKLIFQTVIKAGETLNYEILTGSKQEFAPKTYGRFITERKDDFAWENDRVAFRIYGAALIPIDGPSNGLDLWYKRTDSLIIDKWYKDDLAGIKSYHKDHGEGLDDYKVGRSLGAGMMAPFINDSLILNENFASQELLENGPLRTTFVLTYKDITVNDKSFSEKRTFSLDAGSQFTKVTQEYGTTDTLTVAAGLVKINKLDDAYNSLTDNGTAVVVYPEPESETVGKVYVGMVFPKGLENVISNTYTIYNAKTQKEDAYSHVLGITTYYPGQPITYYTGYGWNKFGFETLTDFQKYIEQFSLSLEEPLIIEIL